MELIQLFLASIWFYLHMMWCCVIMLEQTISTGKYDGGENGLCISQLLSRGIPFSLIDYVNFSKIYTTLLKEWPLACTFPCWQIGSIVTCSLLHTKTILTICLKEFGNVIYLQKFKCKVNRHVCLNSVSLLSLSPITFT